MGLAAAQPTRVDREVYAAAASAAALTGRSVSEQLSHWARVGSEVEALSLGTLARRRRSSQELLDGRDYDTLAEDEQALVRAAWDDEIDHRVAATTVADLKTSAGQTYAGLDEDGNVVLHRPDGTVEPV